MLLARDIEFSEADLNVEMAAGTYPVAVYPAGSDTPVFGPVDVEVIEGQVLSAFAESELNPEDADGDNAEFGPVLAYEEAAPFGRGRGDDDDEEGERGRGGDDEKKRTTTDGV